MGHVVVLRCWTCGALNYVSGPKILCGEHMITAALAADWYPHHDSRSGRILVFCSTACVNDAMIKVGEFRKNPPKSDPLQRIADMLEELAAPMEEGAEPPFNATGSLLGWIDHLDGILTSYSMGQTVPARRLKEVDALVYGESRTMTINMSDGGFTRIMIDLDAEEKIYAETLTDESIKKWNMLKGIEELPSLLVQ